MLPIRSALVALSLLAVDALPAAVLFSPADLRIGYVQGGSAVTSRAQGLENESRWDAVHRVTGEVVLGLSLPLPVTPGILAGLGGVYDRRSSEELRADTLTWRAEAGPFVTFGPVALEAVGQFGQGRTRITDRGSDSADGGEAIEAGVEGRVVVSVVGFVAGVSLGYLDQGLSASPNGTKVEVDSRDYTAGLFLGSRF